MTHANTPLASVSSDASVSTNSARACTTDAQSQDSLETAHKEAIGPEKTKQRTHFDPRETHTKAPDAVPSDKHSTPPQAVAARTRSENCEHYRKDTDSNHRKQTPAPHRRTAKLLKPVRDPIRNSPTGTSTQTEPWTKPAKHTQNKVSASPPPRKYTQTCIQLTTTPRPQRPHLF